MYRLLIYILALLFLSSCESNSISDSVIESSPLRLELAIDPEVTDQIDEIESKFTVTNITSSQVTFGFSSTCQSAFTITQNNDLIFDSIKNTACGAALTSLHLDPNESKTFEIKLWFYEALEELESGNYLLNVFLREGHSPPVSIEFVLK